MKRFIFLLIFPFSVANVLFAQNIIGGRVTERATGEALTGANVMLRNEGGKILKFVISDANGGFRISLGERSAEGLTLHVTMVGMEAFSLALDSPALKDKLEKIEVKLSEKKTELREVTVRAEKIRSEGDTITYLTSSFAKESDRTIGDVMKRMPGIEVEASGRIRYQGLDINKFYIEGNDLLGGKYGVATNGISHEDIGAVEVLENHQPMQVLRGISFSDQAAINLRLKNGAKSTWVVNGDIGGGLSEQPKGMLWQERLLAMMARQNYQSLTSLKSNNTGTDITRDLSDFLVPSRNTELEPFVSVPLPAMYSLEKSRTLMNRTHTVSTNHLWKVGSGEVKTQLDYLNNHVTSTSSSRTTYFLGDEERIIEESLDGKDRENRVTAKVVAEANQREYFLNNTLSAELNWDKTALTMEGNSLPNVQNFCNPNYFVSNNLKFIRRFGRSLVTFTSENELESQPQRLRVDYSEGRVMRQTVDDRAFFSNERAEYGFILRRVHVSMEAGVTAYLRAMESELVSDVLASNGLTTNYFRLYAAPKFEYNLGKFDLTLSYPINLYFYRLPKENRTEALSAPRATLRWKPIPRLSLSASAGLRETPMNLHALYSGAIATNYRTVSRGIGDFYLNKSRNISLYGSYNLPRRGFFTNASASRTWNSTPYRLAQNILGDMIFTEYSHEKTNAATTMLSGRVSKTLDFLAGSFSLGASYLDSERTLLSQGRSTNAETQSLSTSFSLNATPSEYFGWSYDFSFQNNKMQLNSEKTSAQKSLQHNLLLVILPEKPLRFEVGGEYYRNEVQANKFKDIMMCDAKAIYSFNKRAELMLSVTNLFNQKDYSYTSYGTVSQTECMRKLRGREISISIYLKK